MNPEIFQMVIAFRDARQWRPFHTPKNLAISISLEANELLEHFQWLSSEEAVKTRFEGIKEELADVLIYCIYMADTLGLDLDTIIKEKFQKNEEKYPVDKAYGKATKYTEWE